jgi:hypothetical protein
MCIDFKRNGNFHRISPFKIDCKEGRLGDSKGRSDFPMIDCHPLKWVDYDGPQVPTATRSCKVDEISPKSPKKMAQVASRRVLTPINIHSANKNTNIRNITLVPG